MIEAETKGTVDFDPGGLARVLSEALGPANACFRLERISGGQSNPTYFLDWADRRLVLRKKPNGPVLKGAHAIEREYRVLNALKPTEVPVPGTILLHEGTEAIDTPFYVMERVEGRVFDDPSLADLEKSQRRAIWMSAADVLARLHGLDPDAIGLGDFGRPGDYFARQLALWDRQYRASPAPPIAPIETLHRWLAANIPPDDGTKRLCHGDFRLGNLIFHATDPRVVAVLDWELSTLGHPLADLGFVAMAWHTAPEEYGGLWGLDLGGCNLPEEADFLAGYQESLGQAVDLRPFHRAFALYRFAVIFVGIADRARAGTSADPRAASLAPLAERFAIRALEIIEGRGHGAD